MDCFVYVLGRRGKSRTLTYVGWTNDVMRRLEAAQQRQGRALDARTHLGAAAFGMVSLPRPKP